mgnify:CR=1 FL=1
MELKEILKNLYAAMNKDRKAFIKFALKRGHKRTEIAEALGITPAYLSKFINRYKLEVK